MTNIIYPDIFQENDDKTSFHNFYQSLSIVLELAHGNCLDSDDADLIDQVNRQVSALNFISEFIGHNKSDHLDAVFDRYQINYAINDIDACYFPLSTENGKREIDSFKRAKAEVLLKLYRKISCIKTITPEQFYASKNRRIPA